MRHNRGQKPPFAAWLEETRERRGLKAEEVARRLREMGLDASDGTYRMWESRAGRPPRRETIEALERMLGSQAPEEEDLPTSAQLADAMREQALAIREQASAIDRLVAAMSDLAEALRPPSALVPEDEAVAEADRWAEAQLTRADPSASPRSGRRPAPKATP